MNNTVWPDLETIVPILQRAANGMPIFCQI
jgi:hypothetical protein